MACSSHFLIYGRVLGILEVPKSDPGGLRLVAYASESAASLPKQTVALPRGSALRSNWRDDLRVVPNLSRAAASLIMAASPQKWALTEHRPPVVFRKALPRLRICKIMDSKIIYLGHVQQAARMVWEPVPSETDSAPPVVEKWVRRGR